MAASTRATESRRSSAGNRVIERIEADRDARQACVAERERLLKRQKRAVGRQ
jgi:hypothetical protein